MKRLDLIVIGAGSAGISAAHAARRSGAAVAIVESDRLGGDCPNYACNPSKTLLRSARIYSYLKRAGEFGLHVGAISYDWKSVAARRDRIIDLITQNGKRYEEDFARAGIAFVRGAARFISEHTVEVDGRRLSAARFVLATGSRPKIPDVEGLDGVGISPAGRPSWPMPCRPQ